MVNQVAVDACRKLVYDNPHHLDGVRILGVDEHVWKHTRRPCQPSSFVTVLVDLTPLVDGRGPARLLDMRPGRSAEVLRTWLNQCTPGFRTNVQVVTMDGFAGYATAVDEALPAATKVMDPSTSCTWPRTNSPAVGNDSSERPPGVGDARTIHCTNTVAPY